MSDKDPRFARLKSDPRFRRVRKKDARVKVDSRFKSLFEEGSLEPRQAGPSVDKYGRHQKRTKARDQLLRFYRLEDEGIGESSGLSDLARGAVLLESSDEEGGDDDGQEDTDSDVVLASGNISARNSELRRISDIDLDESAFSELEAQAAAYSAATADPTRETMTGEETSRLAVVNLDWDNIHADDLYKVFASVARSQTNGQSAAGERPIRSVRIYPSEFGKERMRLEEAHGPPAEVFRRRQLRSTAITAKDMVEVDEGEDYDNDALRRYQLERLRYFYAVVTCDSPATAAHIYRELDGTELERTANILDLRYVPDGMSFDDNCREEVTEESGSTRVLDFSTTALRHSKVKLTWDEDDPKRNRLTRRALTRKELDEMDFRAYIASSDSDENEDDANSRRDRLRGLLLADETRALREWSGEQKGKGDMEVTFLPGLSAAAAEGEDKEETTLERYQRKQRERHKDRRAAKMSKHLKAEEAAAKEDDFFETNQSEAAESAKPQVSTKAGAGSANEESGPFANEGLAGDETRHFDMQAILRAEKRNRRKKAGQGNNGQKSSEDDTFVVDAADPRFALLHEDTAFALDPSHPKFQHTKGMTSLLEARSMRWQLSSHFDDASKTPSGYAGTEGMHIAGGAKGGNRPPKKRRL